MKNFFTKKKISLSVEILVSHAVIIQVKRNAQQKVMCNFVHIYTAAANWFHLLPAPSRCFFFIMFL